VKESHLNTAVEDLVRDLGTLAAASAYCRETRARVVLFVNRFSGSLADPRLLLRIRDAVARRLEPLSARKPEPLIIAPAAREAIPGELSHLAETLRRSLVERDDDILVLSVGGDGTHKSVLSVLVELSEELRRRVVVFRFPAGSSNDGPTSPDAVEAIDCLLTATDVVSLKALEIETGLGRRELGFNIASFGIDAYTTIKNEQFRGVFGGNSYRALANMAVLFYDLVHDPGSLRLEIESDRGEVMAVEKPLLLVAIGVSGRRTYGGGIAILPEEGNLCIVERLGLFGKMALKGRLLRGTHLGHPRVRSLKVLRLMLTIERPLPIQVDGEARWLSPEESPVTVHLGRQHIQELI
jgi:diacylglycerol kinase family enzyme